MHLVNAAVEPLLSLRCDTGTKQHRDCSGAVAAQKLVSCCQAHQACGVNHSVTGMGGCDVANN